MGWRQIVTDAVVTGVRSALRTASQEAGSARRRGAGPTRPSPSRPIGRTRAGSYPGDLRDGDVRITYAPVADGNPDPGEVVWAWVPYEEDATQGKDRPVLVVAEQGGLLIALMLTSRDRSRGTSADRDGRHWMDVGSGEWDRKRRPSEVRLDRVLRLRPDEVRREGGRLAKDRFDRVAQALREMHGWT